jgi:uncharacterized coiled-coil protein SlyX
VAQQRDEIFDKVEEKKADKFHERLNELEGKVENASPDKYRDLDDETGESHPVAQEIESVMQNVDNIITTLQEDEEVSEREIRSIRDSVSTLDKIEKTSAEGYHLTVREIKDKYKELHEHKDARIREWKSYLEHMSELKTRLYRRLADDLNEERSTKEAVSTVKEFMENRQQEHLDLLTDRFDSLRTDIQNRIEIQVQKQNAELRENVMRQEKELEFLRKEWQQSMDVIEKLVPFLQAADLDDRQQVAELRDDVNQLQNSVGQDLSEKAAQVSNDSTDRSERSGDDQETESGNLFDDVKDQTTAEPVEDSGPEYELYDRSVEEMKEVFDEIEANEDTEDMTIRDIADKTDVSHESVRKKIKAVKDEYGNDITNLGSR